MIDFSLTEEQIALQEMSREFADKEMKPNAAKYDKGDEFDQSASLGFIHIWGLPVKTQAQAQLLDQKEKGET